MIIPDGEVLRLPSPQPVSDARHRRKSRKITVRNSSWSEVRAFGWLTREGGIPQHETDAQDIEAIETSLDSGGLWVIRGYRTCPFCPHRGFGPTRYTSSRGEWNIGNRSVAVADQEGRLWIAPDLVLHYTTEHGYGPGFTMYPAPTDLMNSLDQRCPDLILRI